MMNVSSDLKSRTSSAGLSGVIMAASASIPVDASTNGKAACMTLSTGAVRAALSCDDLLRSRPELAGCALEVYRERPFAVTEGDSLLSGAFDRLVVARRQGRAVFADVLDFKTDAAEPRDEARIGELVDRYRPQMAAYRRAAARVARLGPAQIRCRLLFVSAGAVADV